jgi:proteasome lid subunit RPN8/RPN11
MPISLEAKSIPGIDNGDGTAAMWDAEFVSATQKERRTFTYAVVAHPPDIYKGVTIGKPLPWNGARDITPFSMGQVEVDSDAAFKAATQDAAAWLKQHPEKNPTISLKDLTRYQGVPTWIVFWGTDKLGFRSFISGADGKPMTTK